MQVTLIACTQMLTEGMDADGKTWNLDPKIERWMEVEGGTDADVLAEFAGRSCYQAFDKPREATRRNEDYLANILSQGHESVLEHASATFYIEGVSRALTHELIRHRHLSFSELSQRYVDINKVGTVYPPAVESANDRLTVDKLVLESQTAYNTLVQRFRDSGLSRKQSRETARAVMPNATETRVVVTGNHRAWRDVLKKRYSVHADAEIREMATEILRILRQVAPGTFQDFPEEPFE